MSRYIDSTLITESQQFNKQLGSYSIVDIGMITHVDGDGAATIMTTRLLGDMPVTYTNVELLYIGGGTGAFRSAAAGGIALLFTPNTCVPDTTDMKTLVTAGAYDSRGMKALVLSNGHNTTVNCGFGPTGDLNINGTDWALVAEKDCLHITTPATTLEFHNDGTIWSSIGKGLLTHYLKNDGTSIAVRYDSSGKIVFMDKQDPDGTVTKYYLSKAKPDGSKQEDEDLTKIKNWGWKEVRSPDKKITVTSLSDDEQPKELWNWGLDPAAGTICFTLKDGDDQYLKLDAKKDGTVSLVGGKDDKFTMSLKPTEVAIDVKETGKITLADQTVTLEGGAGTITINDSDSKGIEIAVGSCTFTIKSSEITLTDGKSTLSFSSSGATLDAGSGKVTINGSMADICAGGGGSAGGGRSAGGGGSAADPDTQPQIDAIKQWVNQIDQRVSALEAAGGGS